MPGRTTRPSSIASRARAIREVCALAQRLLVDLELLGAVSLSEAESRSVLDERALGIGGLIFGGHFPLLIALLRDARALYGKWGLADSLS
jgi:hypothetical protein